MAKVTQSVNIVVGEVAYDGRTLQMQAGTKQHAALATLAQTGTLCECLLAVTYAGNTAAAFARWLKPDGGGRRYSVLAGTLANGVYTLAKGAMPMAWFAGYSWPARGGVPAMSGKSILATKHAAKCPLATKTTTSTPKAPKVSKPTPTTVSAATTPKTITAGLATALAKAASKQAIDFANIGPIDMSGRLNGPSVGDID